MSTNHGIPAPVHSVTTHNLLRFFVYASLALFAVAELLAFGFIARHSQIKLQSASAYLMPLFVLIPLIDGITADRRISKQLAGSVNEQPRQTAELRVLLLRNMAVFYAVLLLIMVALGNAALRSSVH